MLYFTGSSYRKFFSAVIITLITSGSLVTANVSYENHIDGSILLKEDIKNGIIVNLYKGLTPDMRGSNLAKRKQESTSRINNPRIQEALYNDWLKDIKEKTTKLETYAFQYVSSEPLFYQITKSLIDSTNNIVTSFEQGTFNLKDNIESILDEINNIIEFHIKPDLSKDMRNIHHFNLQNSDGKSFLRISVPDSESINNSTRATQLTFNHDHSDNEKSDEAIAIMTMPYYLLSELTKVLDISELTLINYGGLAKDLQPLIEDALSNKYPEIGKHLSQSPIFDDRLLLWSKKTGPILCENSLYESKDISFEWSYQQIDIVYNNTINDKESLKRKSIISPIDGCVSSLIKTLQHQKNKQFLSREDNNMVRQLSNIAKASIELKKKSLKNKKENLSTTLPISKDVHMYVTAEERTVTLLMPGRIKKFGKVTFEKTYRSIYGKSFDFTPFYSDFSTIGDTAHPPTECAYIVKKYDIETRSDLKKAFVITHPDKNQGKKHPDFDNMKECSDLKSFQRYLAYRNDLADQLQIIEVSDEFLESLSHEKHLTFFSEDASE